MPPQKVLNNISLTDFLDLVLGPVVEKVSVPVSIAHAITSVDSDEQYCHIEYLEGQKPRLWRIADWRTDYANQQRKKELSAKERQCYVLLAELRTQMLKKVVAITYLPEEQALEIVNGFIRTRNPQAAAAFGIDIQPLLEAEDTFKQAQQKK